MAQNRLSNESSLYLRQHADNPVDWWPWCEEAFDAAKKANKPVLVSIGYSSCHWCHVMAHECFEDDYIASLMNRLFINIKVDREERPDVDQIYMEAVQMLNQQGGWPLNVFCFPDKKPFTGGTYFPPEDRGHGIIPWPHLLLRISDAYQNEQDGLRSNADAIQQNLKYLSDSVLEESREWHDDILIDGARSILTTLDKKYGGFGDAPKFPPSQILGYLMSVRGLIEAGSENVDFLGEIDDALKICSHAMVRGGLFDHIGGGFFRYSVDRQWRVPHFEKMLYDNALLLENLSKIWSRTRWSGLESAVRKTVAWLFEDFQIVNGVFASALDADTSEGEGAYYLWSETELAESVPSTEVEAFSDAFSIKGKDKLNLYPWSIDDEGYRKYALILNDLKDLRNEREAPTLDRKVLLSWNGLILKGLVVAGTVYGEKGWLEKARIGLDWLWENLRREDGTLASVYYEETGAIRSGDGFLDDYVNFALANLQFACVADCLEPGSHILYKNRAVELVTQILKRFADDSESSGGFYFCSEVDAEPHIARKKEWFDNAYPCGNSGVVHLFSLLGNMGCDINTDKELTNLKKTYVERSRRMPNGIAFGLEGLTWDALGVVSIKVGSKVDRDELMAAIRAKPWRPFWVLVDSTLPDSQIQVCVGSVCHAPTESSENAFEGLW